MRVAVLRVWMAVPVVVSLALLALAGCGSTPNQWQTIGPGNAEINTLVADPQAPGLLFAGSSDGTTYYARGDYSGVFVASEKSPGGGPVNVIFPNLYTAGVVYAGTASGFFSSSDHGVHFASHDRGLPSDANVTAITTGGDGSTLFVTVAQKGLYRSGDGGTSWTALTPESVLAGGATLPNDGTVQALLWDGAAKSLYAAISDADAGVYVSQSGGISWNVSSDGLPAKTSVYALLVLASGGVAPSGPTLYAATSAGVFARGAGATTWEKAGEGIPPGAIYSLAKYSATPGLLYAGTAQTVYFSTDGGRHWRQVAGGLAHQVPAIVVSPGKNTPTVTYAAAGQIARYPAATSGGNDFITPILLLLMIVFAGWYILGHYHIVPSFTDVRRRLTRRATMSKQP
jgi:hypothetical protein